MNEHQNQIAANQHNEKQQAHFERAKKGILKFLNENGGALPLAQMHDHSLNKYLIQHQGFSRMMETLVEEKLVEYDFEKDLATLTDLGRTFALN